MSNPAQSVPPVAASTQSYLSSAPSEVLSGGPRKNYSTDNLEKELRNVIQSLYELSVSTYRNDALNPAEILINQIADLMNKLEHTNHVAGQIDSSQIPREVIGYVEHGRNPDIYTREFVELAIKQNQYLNGKQIAFRTFRDILAEQILVTLPELNEDVQRVVDNTSSSGIADTQQ